MKEIALIIFNLLFTYSLSLSQWDIYYVENELAHVDWETTYPAMYWESNKSGYVIDNFGNFRHIKEQTLKYSLQYETLEHWKSNFIKKAAADRLVTGNPLKLIDKENGRIEIIQGHEFAHADLRPDGSLLLSEGGRIQHYKEGSGISLLFESIEYKIKVSSTGRHAVFFTDENNVYFFGESNNTESKHLQLFQSDDGGNTWDARGETIPFNSVENRNFFHQFVDKNRGYYTSENGFFETTDGGFTWQKIDNERLQVWFYEPEKAWRFDDKVLYHSSDRGRTWSESLKLEEGSQMELMNQVSVVDNVAFVMLRVFSKVNSSEGQYRVGFTVLKNQYFENQLSPTVITEPIINSSANNLTENPLSISPNPVSNKLSIQTGNSSGTLRLFDLSGKELMSEKVSQNDKLKIMPVSEFSEGLYLLRFESEKGIWEKKVLIRK